MRTWLWGILIFCFCFFLLHAELINDSLYISPLYTDALQSSMMFSNPAEMAHWNNVVGGEIRYRSPANSFSGTLTLKTPDFFLGNFSFSMETFGSDFGSNLIWIPETSIQSGHFSLTEGGQKYTLGWAKRLNMITLGADFKYYRYRELDTGLDENGVGLDIGMLWSPLDRMYFGLVVNDLSNTKIYNQNKALLYTLPASLRLTIASSASDDLSFSVGIPMDLLNRDWDSRDPWKKTSFSIRKIWDKGLNAELGYNSRDAYGALGYIISDAISIKLIISNDLTIQDGIYQCLFIWSGVIPARIWTSISEGVMNAKTMIDGNQKQGNSPWDFLINIWMGINDNLITRSVYLNDLNLEQARAYVADMLSPDGRIEIDQVHRRLIITDFKDKVSDIMDALRRLPHPLSLMVPTPAIHSLPSS